MSDQTPATVEWRQHPVTEKWHAFRSDEERSVCRYTNQARAESVSDPPVGSCWLCCSALKQFPPKVPVPRIKRSQHDHDRHEVMDVEFIGGLYDGMRIKLDVVREGADRIRVLELAYERTHKKPKESSVEAG